MIGQLQTLLDGQPSAEAKRLAARNRRVSFIQNYKRDGRLLVQFVGNMVEVGIGQFLYHPQTDRPLQIEKPVTIVEHRDDFPSEKLVAQIRLVLE